MCTRSMNLGCFCVCFVRVAIVISRSSGPVKDAVPLSRWQSACHRISPGSLRGQVGSMTGPARDQHGGAQGWLGHESGYLRVKFTYPLGKKFPVSGINRAESKQLYPGLCVYLEEHPMEVWMPGQCV